MQEPTTCNHFWRQYETALILLQTNLKQKIPNVWANEESVVYELILTQLYSKFQTKAQLNQKKKLVITNKCLR